MIIIKSPIETHSLSSLINRHIYQLISIFIFGLEYFYVSYAIKFLKIGFKLNGIEVLIDACIYIYIERERGDQKVPFSIATTPNGLCHLPLIRTL